MRQTVPQNNTYYWTLSSDALTIRNKDKVYKAVDYNNYELVKFTMSSAEIHMQYLGYADAETTAKYDGSYINYTLDSVNSVLQVWLKSSGMWTTATFVEESYISTFMQLKTANADNYTIENDYGITMPVKPADYKSLDSGEMLVSPKGQLGFDLRFYRYNVYAVDVKTDLMIVVGEILQEIGTQNYYFLDYADYDETYFDSDGYFSIATSKEVRIYKIDANEQKSFVESMNTLVDERPDDDLGWIGGDETSDTMTAVVGAIFFIGLPLAAAVFCVIALVRSKKKMYRFPLITLLCTSVTLSVVSLIVMVCISNAP